MCDLWRSLFILMECAKWVPVYGSSSKRSIDIIRIHLLVAYSMALLNWLEFSPFIALRECIYIYILDMLGSGQLGYNFRKCLSFACIQSSILFSHLGLITLFLKSMQCFSTTWVMTLVHPLHLLQCWLKKQKDTLAPERQDLGKKVIWTSGLIFGKGEVYNLNIFG